MASERYVLKFWLTGLPLASNYSDFTELMYTCPVMGLRAVGELMGKKIPNLAVHFIKEVDYDNRDNVTQVSLFHHEPKEA